MRARKVILIILAVLLSVAGTAAAAAPVAELGSEENPIIWSFVPSGEMWGARSIYTPENEAISGSLHSPSASLIVIIICTSLTILSKKHSFPSGEKVMADSLSPVEIISGAKITGVVSGAACPR